MKKFLCSFLVVIAIILSTAIVFGAFLLRSYPVCYREIAKKYRSDWRLVLSVIKAESSFRPYAESETGAKGLMQILPSTAEFISRRNGIDSYDLFEPEDNIRLGCLYFDYLEVRFSDPDTVLAAYNAGEGTVREWLKNERYSSDGKTLRNVPYPETENYIIKIKKYYRKYSEIYLTK